MAGSVNYAYNKIYRSHGDPFLSRRFRAAVVSPFHILAQPPKKGTSMISKKSARAVGFLVVALGVAFLTVVLMHPTSAASPTRQATSRSAPTGVSSAAHISVTNPRTSSVVAKTSAPAPTPIVTARLLAWPQAWTPTRQVVFRVAMSSSVAFTWLRPQVEVVPVGQPFASAKNAPRLRFEATHRGRAIPATIVVGGLRNDTIYHWRLRVRDIEHGVASPWIEAAGARTHVYTQPPSAPLLSASALKQGAWSPSRHVAVRWTTTSKGIGLRGFSYSVSSHSWVRPYFKINTTRRQAAFTVPSNGRWYIAVRAMNRAGLWGKASLLSIHVDASPPHVDVLSHAVKIDPAGPTRQALLDLHLSDWDHVYVDVLTKSGRPLRTLATLLHAPGDVVLVWDGRSASGVRFVNQTALLRVTARSRAGLQWRATYPLLIQNVAPNMSDGQSQTGTYNLYNNAINGPEVLTATIDTPGQMRIDAMRDGETLRSWSWPNVKAGETITATWNGRFTSGTIMPGGTYRFRVSYTDIYGTKGHAQIGWVVLDRRRIVVSLAQQRLWALDGDNVLLTTLVTTGGPELPTPTGDYQIIDRESPFTFHSPFPVGSPFWYAPSPTNFALLFQANGYFIHDAPWRNVYGPGSNTTDGTPGGDYTGTHGCVNTPYDAMSWLFNWATYYTPVQVRSEFSTSAPA